MEKKLNVMTSFGPVPFDAVRDYLPKELVEKVDKAYDEILKIVDSNKIEFYIAKLAAKHGYDYNKMVNYLNELEKISVGAVFSILLREIATHLDNKYDGTINKVNEIYCISVLNGKIYKGNKTPIKNYRNFSAFRTEEDAKFAKKLLAKYIRKMFRGCGKQEDKGSQSN